jgi:hypothetical protein
MRKHVNRWLTVVAILALLVGVTAQAATMEAHYTFDNGANLGEDTSGNDYDVDFNVGSPTQNNTDAKVGTGALSLNGSSGLADTAGFPTGNLTNYFVAAWVRVDAVSVGAVQSILSTRYGSAGTASGFLVYINSDDSIRVNTYAASTPASLSSGVDITANTWVHVAASYDGATSRIYVNGVEENYGTRDYTVSGGDDISIGVRNSGGTNPFSSGDIDDVGVWNEVLSTGKIAALYNLAVDSLAYDAGDANTLFELYDSGSGTATAGGTKWVYATGLTGSVGEVLNSEAVVLDASGNGVQFAPRGTVVSVK